MADTIPNSLRIRSVDAPQSPSYDVTTRTNVLNEEAPFVWSLMGQDAGQPLDEIIIRKDAERKTGGTFWWGLGTPLGPRLGSAARANGGRLSALFSRSARGKAVQRSNQVYLWDGWCSIRPGKRGTIPEHVLVLGGTPARNYYALVCQSDAQVHLGDHGPFDPSQCLTVAKGKAPGPSQRSALLTSQTKHFSNRYRVAFEADLVDPWFVKLTDCRLLNADELAEIRRFKDGDDWLALCTALRRR